MFVLHVLLTILSYFVFGVDCYSDNVLYLVMGMGYFALIIATLICINLHEIHSEIRYSEDTTHIEVSQVRFVKFVIGNL